MLCVGLGSVLLYSCLDDDDGYSLGKFWIEIVTVVPDGNTYYLRRDDGTTLWPAATNIPYYRPKEEIRVMANYTILGDSVDKDFDYYVKVNRIDEILTKDIAEDKGAANDSIYGKDPVEIADIWAGDDYLNIYFKTYYRGNVKHFINLIPSEDEEAMLEFRHNAYGELSGYKQGGLVAFDLSTLDSLNIETPGDSTTLTVKVKTFDGDKIYKVKYAPKPSSTTQARYFEDVTYGGIE